ncbi:Pimeloyl-ACP methyl ester carboxylesterase [Actinokineospora alba]|uniref:Pimeloyl-ACP methyl ester carboxylesterase n=1 Tax=Actinokineospora alba TaxID=504798 RepID=A0A1H0VZ75_9PSEU|nr:alpha/beta fold hydrolase [Actinokineospora alba]TDP67073.1 pimeloyl-ACP methyl ester carboxylesterase [Actinokineospora alba]SDJ47428.1 Pimeloyl-ACP methyl ester carboxylesterase [Actinokineospora alba]SDP83661.1 Pimeloyl-ACP methyl ester carboxylesterase [Actinokineospora alba]
MSLSTTFRAPLTRVPLSETPLPPLDLSSPAWPGEEITSGGHTLHVRRTPGAGDETAVYVHGLGGSAMNWTDLAGQLSGRAPGLSVDLPGFGRTAPSEGFPYTLEAHADTLAEWLRGLDLGRVHLLGNSMGGAISMVLAARHPDLLRTLTLVSPAVPDLRPSVNRMSDPRMALAFLPLVGPPMRRQLAMLSPHQRARQLLDLCFADPTQVTQERLDEAAHEFAERAKLAWANPALARSTVGLIRAWMVPRTRSLWSLAPKITTPTLVVWGTEDKLVTVRKAPRITRLLPHARLLVLPRVGHVAQMERPVTVARAVLGLWETAALGEW